SARLLCGFVGVWGLQRTAVPAPAWLIERIKQLAYSVRMPVPRLQLSTRVPEAITVGILKPMILIPVAWMTELPPDMVESVLAHELAHVLRRDLWINLLQRLAETLLFYHPIMWWLSRRLRIERELCCDEFAVGLTQNGLRYAETLEHIGRMSIRSSEVAFGV